LQTIRLFIGGLSARQFNGCLPRREEKRRREGYLSACETGDATGFRQQLSMTSFEASELEVAVNYPVHT